MRSWFVRHPSAMVILLVLCWLVVAEVTWGPAYHQHDWLGVGCGFVVGVILYRHIKTWWHRT